MRGNRRTPMTDELRPVPGEDTYETDDGLESEAERETDTTPQPESPAEPPREPNPWLKEGADAPDAADIEDPDEQR
jgi:hypothetical protein